ncbi:GNAT family N-acetyltransferase [Pasteurellaceae bacterium LIM206]|nr:GNAT family N-acetyltransferase [Pasteurellaceae bacterium LIM206]
MLPRRLNIIVGDDSAFLTKVRCHFCEFFQSGQAVVLGQDNFAKAKNLLGREFALILYDARQGLNLEALAIAVGTLKSGGLLLLWFADWRNLSLLPDADSLRWSGESQPIATPNFTLFFRRLCDKYRFPIYVAERYFPPKLRIDSPQSSLQSTAEQQHIIRQILRQESELYLITAKRGRGKSALAGLAAAELAKRSGLKIYLTAPNKSAVRTLLDFARNAPAFIAPDELCRQIRLDAAQFEQAWLIIDEAAMIPLEMLFGLTSAFKHVICSTTVQSYEGTGRGFLLKFLPGLRRTFQHFELFEPLRWTKNDPLEAFIDELLLVEAEERLSQPAFQPQSAVLFRRVLQPDLQPLLQHFYGLLTLAHYRTSPVDLRRLFDAPKQQFWLAERENTLLAGAWLLAEGGMQDTDLIEDICTGLRRPKGNLVAQSLAFQANLPQACRLKSLRISRIAVQPNWQNHGIGQQLIERIARHSAVDFLSVSFGYTSELMRFWQRCGFELVHIGDNKEATSGCYSAIALRALSAAGRRLSQQALRHFERNFPFSRHELADLITVPLDWRLTGEDMAILKNFVFSHRTLSGSIGAIRRLWVCSDARYAPLLTDLFASGRQKNILDDGRKARLGAIRREVKILLQNRE